MGINRTLLRGFAAGVATVALLAGGASAASALSYDPDPANSGHSMTVTSTGALSADIYRVGIGTTAVFGILRAPACGAMSEVEHAGGAPLIAVLPSVSKSAIANQHVKLHRQPTHFDCSVSGQCEVVISKHRWFGTSVVERAPLVFN